MPSHFNINTIEFRILFFLVGPNSDLGLKLIIFKIEALVNYVLREIQELRRGSVKSSNLRADALRAFNDRIQDALSKASGTRL